MDLSHILALAPPLTPERRKLLIEHYQNHTLTEEEVNELFHYITSAFAALRQQTIVKPSLRKT